MAVNPFVVRTGLIVGANAVVVNSGTMAVFSNTLVVNTSTVGVNTNSAAVTFHIHANDAIRIPVGNTAQRPSPAANGFMRYNQETNRFEVVANSGWREVNVDLKIYNVSGTQLYPTP
jgi:hypothetical protein